MASKMPPVPPGNRSTRGAGADPSVKADTTIKEGSGRQFACIGV